MYRHDLNKEQVTYQDVASYFSEEEWKLLHDWQKELYSKVMTEVHQALISLGPLITSAVYTLRTKEMNYLCSVDHQNSNERHSIDDIVVSSVSFWKNGEEIPSLNENRETGLRDHDNHGFDVDKHLEPDHVFSPNCFVEDYNVEEEESRSSFITGQSESTPSIKIRIKEEIETGFMDNQELDRMENLSKSEDKADVTPMVNLRIKEEVEAHLIGNWDSDRIEIINSSEDDATVNLQPNCGKFVKSTKWTLPRKASARKNRVLSISDKQMQSGSGMWPEQYKDLAEIDINQHKISFGNPSNFTLDKKTPMLKSTVKCDTYLPDVVNGKISACPQQNLPIFRQQKRTPDMSPGYQKSINMNAVCLQQQMTYVKDRTFKCVECEKIFRWKSNLIRHHATHRGERPFQCRICQKCFNRNDNLIIHQRKHTGERPYKCTVCMKDFKHNRNLMIHQAIHMGD